MLLDGAETPAAPKPQPPSTSRCFHPTGWENQSQQCPPPSSHSVFGARHVHGKPLGKEPPRYRPTPASRATTAPRELSWRATGATSTQCPGAASTTAPGGCAASPWGPCGRGEGEGNVLQPQELLPRSPAMHHAPTGHVVAVLHVSTRLCSPSARLTKRRASTWGVLLPTALPTYPAKQPSPARCCRQEAARRAQLHPASKQSMAMGAAAPPAWL